jgi:hypothetical protein
MRVKKTKVLVCGSTSFLMSVFIRYVLYRSKDFEIVSVDDLQNVDDVKNIYIHENHKFYIGKMSDSYFVSRLILLEKPDYIVYGDETLEYVKTLQTIQNLKLYNIPIIYISPTIEENDHNKFYNMIKEMLKDNNIILEAPNRFGMRQKANMHYNLGGNISLLIHDTNKIVSVTSDRVPWIYAEDLSSLIWYLIENPIIGVTQMPPLGLISEREIVEIIIDMYAIKCSIREVKNPNIFSMYKYNKSIQNWRPDSTSLVDSLKKTIRWYNVNRWAL